MYRGVGEKLQTTPLPPKSNSLGLAGACLDYRAPNIDKAAVARKRKRGEQEGKCWRGGVVQKRLSFSPKKLSLKHSKC